MESTTEEVKRCEFCFGKLVDFYGYVTRPLKVSDTGKYINLDVCTSCRNDAVKYLILFYHCNRLIIHWNGDRLEFYQYDDVIPEKGKYGIATDSYFDDFIRNYVSPKWMTKETVPDNLIVDWVYLMWRDTGEIVFVDNHGAPKKLLENPNFQKLVTDPRREFMIDGEREQIGYIHQVLYDKKSICEIWFETVDEVKKYMHSGIFHTELDALIITDEFKEYYRSRRNKLREMLKDDKY